ncbi:MAG: histidinol dehydrogenase, partial [Thermoanaerobaculia bacterium]|nr:histidinol dehydrogenase [Thermoanaerobaculia bacterium]
MQHILYPDLQNADTLLARPAGDLSLYREKVADMLTAVRREGDAAVRRFCLQFDGQEPAAVTEAAFEQADALLSPALKAAIRQAYANIHAFHAAQKEEFLPLETLPGVRCWRRSVPIERVGLYIPGGTAPLFSTVLMLGVPAQLAACPEVILCTPPRADGSVHPAVLFSAALCGIRKVFSIGGVQAIGAMAYGTETVPRVWKIFGPGNPWVTAAKQLASLDGVAIDLPAGPSEVAVVADAPANPVFVAADLLSQAEHGADSQVLLITDSESLLEAVEAELSRQIADLPRQEMARQAIAHSKALLVGSVEEAVDWVNLYAPEHLILHTQQAEQLAERIVNAGSVFLGPCTPESAGDYASGTNHTLPTGGYARAYAGVSLDSFVKKITFQQITEKGLEKLGPTIVEMANAEGLAAHARAVTLRLSEMNNLKNIESLVRPNIRALKPYSSARD